MLYYLVTYLKKDNELIQRVITTPTYEVGQETSMGWKVIDMQVFYNGYFRSMEEFNYLFNKEYSKYVELARKNAKKWHRVKDSLKSFSKKIDNLADKL